MDEVRMPAARLVALCSLLIAGIALLAPTGASAQTADSNWSCRASVARVVAPIITPPPLEPITANSGESVCADDFGGANNVEIPPGPGPLVAADAVHAHTDILCATDDPNPDVTSGNNNDCDIGHHAAEKQAVARTDLTDVDIGIAAADLSVSVETANTRVRGYCTPDGVAALESSSQLLNVTVQLGALNIPIVIPPDNEPVVVELPLGLGTIYINRRIGTEGPLADGAESGTLTRRALEVDLSSLGINVVVGESTADIHGDVCPPAQIVIKKQTAPDEAANETSFGFTSTGGLDPAAFSLTDDGVRTFTDLTPGDYTVTETAPAEPYRLGLLECADPTGDTTTSVDTRTATIDVRPGETVTCAFVNTVGDTKVVCPPGTLPDEDILACVITNVQCPDGTVFNPSTVQCVRTNVICPDGTQFNPSTVQCVPSTGGQIVPKGDVRGAAGSPCLAAKYGRGLAIVGTNGVDRLTGTNGPDAIFAFGGKDRISGGRGNDCVEGGSGADKLDGSNGNDRLRGGSGNDIVESGPGADILEGGGGRDNLVGANGRDVMRGGGGNDKIGGGLGVDRIFGGAGTDRIAGGQGKDVIKGGPGRDIINVAIVGPPTRVDCGPGKRDNVRLNRNELGRIKNCEFVDIVSRIFD
jgi:RTX calcium-binding nonapeptide repeat (4 copies)